MDDDNFVALLETVRAKRAQGIRVDLDQFREQLGDRWHSFRELLEFDSALGMVLEEAPATSAPDMPRRFGSYTLLHEIGSGAIGVVYEAHDEGLDRRVALKTLRPEFEADKEFRKRYEREARSCAQVRHPHLVEVYEAGEVDGRLFYAMPFLTGGSLSDAIREKRLPSPSTLCARMAEIAGAVGALHDARIVHRDIKPANIVVEADGRLILADFGLARRIDLPALTGTGQSVGTPQFMSPEQLAGKTRELDARTDIYALGATLYQTLSGRAPFESPSYEALYQQVLFERPDPLDSVAEDITPEMARVVMKCLEKRPDDRYQSARELEADLRAAAAGQPVSARSIPGLTRLLRAVRAPHIAVAGLVLAALGVGIALSGDGEQPQETAEILLSLPPDGKLDADVIDDLVQSARKHGIPITIKFESASLGRNFAAVAPVQLVFPRGAVRTQDLDVWRVDVSEAIESGGMLVFQRGEETLARVPFDPTEHRTEHAMPQAVLDAARPGVRMTWSFVPERGKPVRASFELVAPDLAPAFARIDELGRVPGQPAIVRPLLRALVLLEHDLGVGAYRALESLRPDVTVPRLAAIEADSLPAVRLQIEALRRAFGADAGPLERADVWQRLGLRQDAIAARNASR